MGNKQKPKLQKDDLEQLLREDIASYEATNLTAAGDNYGSVMLAVTVITRAGRELQLVAKMFPESPIARKHFNSPLSTRKEIDMYTLVSPELEKFQREACVPVSERLSIFCKCLGARLTLEGSGGEEMADENSLFLLENLKVQGYRIGDRVVGQDLTHSELVMTRLAQFHATALAVKLRKPDVFKSTILKACEDFKIRKFTKAEDEVRAETFIGSLRTIPVCEENIEVLRTCIEEYVSYVHSDAFATPTEPFATLIHDDLWTNNMMFKYDSEEGANPIDLKIFDFQVVKYGSPAKDVIFFLFTSTQTGIVTQHLDHLLKLYHDTFVKWLVTLGCEPNVFLFSDFLNELKLVARSEITHMLYWLVPITIHKHQMENFSLYSSANQTYHFNEDFIKKTCDMVTVFLKKKWL